MFIPQEIIRRKRDGAELVEDEIAAFVRGLRDGSIAGRQLAPFASAAFRRGRARPGPTAPPRVRAGSTLATTRAGGLEGGVMDAKPGWGASLPKEQAALGRGRSCVAAAARGGWKAVALRTEMGEVLGSTAGNALEIGEAI